VGYDESKTKEPSSYAAYSYQQPADTNSSRAALVNVRVEPYHHPRGINRKDGRRNLCRIHQIEGMSTEVHGSSQLAEQSPLGFPRDAIGESALDLETFLPLHPRIDGGQHVARISGNGSRSSCVSGAGDLGDKSPFLGDVDARSFFRQRLIDGRGVEPDFVSYVEELTLADEIAGIGQRAGALQLRRPRENALERLSIQQCLSSGERRLLIGHAELYALKSRRVRPRADG
jgi:hypothetical protein